MIILIDGYNVLKQALKKRTIDQNEINTFVNILNDYRKNKKHVIYLFFDGGPFKYSFRKIKNDIVIVYSGQAQSADDSIKEFIDEFNNKENLLLVTSDHELLRFADSMQVNSMDSLLFYNNILKLYGKQSEDFISNRELKIFHKNLPDLDELMKEGSKKLLFKDEKQYEKDLRKASNKPSKAEKKLIKILKKL